MFQLLTKEGNRAILHECKAEAALLDIEMRICAASCGRVSEK